MLAWNVFRGSFEGQLTFILRGSCKFHNCFLSNIQPIRLHKQSLRPGNFLLPAGFPFDSRNQHIMDIRVIPYASVATDHAATKAIQDSSQPSSSRSQRFNTTDHSRLAILPLVPERLNFRHEAPPWTPYGYAMWQPLIARSQNMSNSHVVNIPSFLYKDLMVLFSQWMTTGDIDGEAILGIIETWRSTKSGKQINELLGGKKK